MNALSSVMSQHPIRSIADDLKTVLGTEIDPIRLCIYLSLVGGAIGQPFNLAICSDSAWTDQFLAQRLFDSVATEQTSSVSRQTQLLQKLAAEEISPLLEIKGPNSQLFELAIQHACQDSQDGIITPSILRIASNYDFGMLCGPTLALRSITHHITGTKIRLVPFIKLRSEPNWNSACARLFDHVNGKIKNPEISDALSNAIVETLPLEKAILVSRMTVVVAALSGSPRDNNCCVKLDDYEFVRQLLQKLPHITSHQKLSARALNFARGMWQIVSRADFQNSIPDYSDFGTKAFDRTLAVKRLNGPGYSSVRKYIDELQEAGVLESTRDRSERKRGASIFYKFRASQREFNGAFEDLSCLNRNPFHCLPSATEIARFARKTRKL
ncbi:MAG: hypothetical protein QM811_13435 [Pirellulales bacterium]